MPTRQLFKSGIFITENEKGIRLVFPNQKQGNMAFFYSFFLILFIGPVTLMMLLNIVEVMTDSTKPRLIFIVVLGILLATFIHLTLLTLWALAGKTIILINSIGMTFRNEMLGFAQEKKFELEKIHNLRVGDFGESILFRDDNRADYQVSSESLLVLTGKPLTSFRHPIREVIVEPELSERLAVNLMSREEFIAILERSIANFKRNKSPLNTLLNTDITKPANLQPSNILKPKDLLKEYRYSNGFCHGIKFNYENKTYEFGVGFIYGEEAEQVISIITKHYLILGSRTK